MKFSVLQSVYKNVSPEYLEQSLISIAENTLQPEIIVLVKDGKLNPQLETVITNWQKKLPLKIIGYEQNQGLGYALNYGLQFITTELVCRMDSDDIAVPDRFQIQISFMEQNTDIMLSSGYINEFISQPDKISYVRKVPLSYEEIIQYLKHRNAFNHMAVCFRKSAVIDAGSYQNIPCFEDYDLWIRIIQKGYKVQNIPQILVNARIGNNMVERRHGLKYAKAEIYFLKRQLQTGFISQRQYISLLITRVPARLLPKFLLKIIYNFLRKKDSNK